MDHYHANVGYADKATIGINVSSQPQSGHGIPRIWAGIEFCKVRLVVPKYHLIKNR